MREKVIFTLVLILLLVLVPGCSANTSEKAGNDTNQNDNVIKLSVDDSKDEIQTEFTINNSKVILVQKEIIEKKFSILIPQTFSIMSEELAKIKYPTEQRPKIIYTNEAGTVNVAFSHTQNKAMNSQIKDFKNYLKEVLTNQYGSATWYSERIETISGKNVGILELLTPAIDTNIYNLIFFFELNGRLMMGTFNCTEKEMDDYKPVANSIFKSIKISNK